MLILLARKRRGIEPLLDMKSCAGGENESRQTAVLEHEVEENYASMHMALCRDTAEFRIIGYTSRHPWPTWQYFAHSIPNPGESRDHGQAPTCCGASTPHTAHEKRTLSQGGLELGDAVAVLCGGQDHVADGAGVVLG